MQSINVINAVDQMLRRGDNQMATMKCPRCGSEKIMPNLRIHDRYKGRHDDWIGIEIEGKPDALIFKDTHKEFLRATVCGECGNVELTADNPKGLWETYCQSKDS